MAAAASTQGTTLAELAAALGGKYDPPPPPPPVPRARTDRFVLTATLPDKEAARAERQRALGKGGVSQRLPLPGEESDEDEAEVRRILTGRGPSEAAVRVHAGARAVARLRAQPAVVALLARTVDSEQWRDFKAREKARAPHVPFEALLHV